MKRKNNSGMSLIEILVVVSIFAVLGVIVTRAVILTLGGSKKSESLVRVRENLNYSLGVIERQLRNADSVSECPNTDNTRIDFQDRYGNVTSFSCLNEYVASGSSRLTSTEIEVVSCSFVCSPGIDKPASVTVSITAQDTNNVGIQNAVVETKSKIYLRNY